MKKPVTAKKIVAASPAAKPEIKKATSTLTEAKTEKAAKPKAHKKETAEESPIEKVCKQALAKLKELNIDESLQSEIAWCLGSFAHDGNPEGLYQMAKRALAIFTVEFASKTKGVTVKLISDLEKAIGKN